MNSDSIIQWARQHKSDFVSAKNFAGIPRAPAAICMAGLPGSGKTEFVKHLLANSGYNFLHLDLDEIASRMDGYTPERADAFRAGASIILDHMLDKTIHNGYAFILDGTFGGKKAVKNVKRLLEHGYTVRLIYIHQDPSMAWKYTCAREKIEHRAIDFDGFIKTYYQLHDNLQLLKSFASDQFSAGLIVKGAQNHPKYSEDIFDVKRLDEFVKFEYNEDTLRRQLNYGQAEN